MKHKIGFNRLGRRQGHRKALKNNMVTSLFRYERVETTKAKALEIKRVAEKMVTRARVDSVHNRRIIGERIHDQEVLAKLFTEIAPRYLERPGGYTRVLKTGRRLGDAAETVILELVDRVIVEKVRKPRKVEEEAAETDETVAEHAAESDEVATEEATAEPEAEAESAPKSAPKRRRSSGTKASSTKASESKASESRASEPKENAPKAGADDDTAAEEGESTE